MVDGKKAPGWIEKSITGALGIKPEDLAKLKDMLEEFGPQVPFLIKRMEAVEVRTLAIAIYLSKENEERWKQSYAEAKEHMQKIAEKQAALARTRKDEEECQEDK